MSATPEAPTDLVENGADTDPKGRWRHALAWGFATFALSRIMVLVGTALAVTAQAVDPKNPGKPRPSNAYKGIVDGLTSWDGRWYLEIVRRSYPSYVQPNVTYSFDDTRAARAAFFPLYPSIVRILDPVIPQHDSAASLVVSMLFGVGFVYLIGQLARRVYGIEAARRSMMLVSLFPGSFVLSYAYSECVLVVLALLCLWALRDQRWLLAGLAGALATSARPNGIALIVACGITALDAVIRRREWKALIAPLLAPIGFVGFHLYLWRKTGEFGVWFRIQREAWDEGYSFGGTAIEGIVDFFAKPLSSPADSITVFTIALMVAMLVAAYKVGMPLPMWAYSISVLVLMLIPDTVTARPRFLFTAFPLIIAVGGWWKERWNEQWAITLAISGSALMAVAGLYGGYGAIP